MRYYFDGKKIKSTTCKVTAKYVYSAIACYPKPLGFKTFSNPASAIRFWIKAQKSKIGDLEKQAVKIQEEIKVIQKTIDKADKIKKSY